METFTFQLLNKNKNKKYSFLSSLFSPQSSLHPCPAFKTYYFFSFVFLIPEVTLAFQFLNAFISKPQFLSIHFLYSVLFPLQGKILLIADFILLCLNGYYPLYNAITFQSWGLSYAVKRVLNLKSDDLGRGLIYSFVIGSLISLVSSLIHSLLNLLNMPQ